MRNSFCANFHRRCVAITEMGAKLVGAPACYGSSLGSNPDTSQNTK
jgi:hypothetical protein